MANIVIAIDGPAGAGKSTVAKRIAKSLGYLHIDSGALFRAITYKIIEKGIEIDDINSIIDAAENSQLDFIEERMYMDGKNIDNEIRSDSVNSLVSYIAKIPKIRAIVDQVQRDIALDKNVVIDGRDIGTTVFPEAFAKFYLTASVEERARRRLKDFNDANMELTLDEVKSQIVKRDSIDSKRSISPLKQADDAILIDTDHKTIDEVVDIILYEVKKKGEGICCTGF